MIFCPNCGTKLVLVRSEQDVNNTLEYQCSKCGYTNSNLLGIKDHLIIKPNISEETIVVFGKKELEPRTMPTSRAECSKCHNDLAYIWQVQTRAGDEGSTQFFRCTKCSHTWRLYT
jgi:DNA-directed RNA polymerase subunit M